MPEREFYKNTNKNGVRYEYEVAKGTHIRDGLYKNWWPNGNQSAIANYSNGFKHGRCTSYSSNGMVNNISIYDQNEIIGERIIFHTGLRNRN
jgi:antitoxin component YwqK of YwqJK toxin-antitoxin module